MTCPPDHRHGASRSCYIKHRCRCADCRAYGAELERNRRRLQAYGRPTNELVSAGPVRERLILLREWGYGYRRLEELTGIGQITVRRHLRGECARVSRRVEERVLAVKPSVEGLADGAQIPARGAHRRIHALRTLGWSSADLADCLNVDRRHIAGILFRDKITARWHQRIDAAYQDLCMIIPEQTPVRKRMRTISKNQPAPLAWDDIDTDSDPKPPAADELETVDEVAVELAIKGDTVRLNHAEKLEGLRRMHPLKWSNDLIAEHLGCDERTVNRLRKEIGLPGWDQNDVTDRRAA